MAGTIDEVELRIGTGFAGTQTVEVVASEKAARDLRAVLDDHDIGFDTFDDRVDDLPGGVVMGIGAAHLGPGGSGLGEALQDLARRLDPIVPVVTIGGIPYELSESGAVASALVALRTAQDEADAVVDRSSPPSPR